MSSSYHRIIRKVVVAFGNLFNNISLSRYDSNGVEQEHFLVPIVYGGKEKYVSRLEGDPNLDKKVQVTLPVMSFEMVDMSYDSSRKLNTNQKLTHASGAEGSTSAVYNPVPFNFDFELYAYVRNIEDGAQLMEKILPFFTPDYTLSVNLIPEMGIVKQLPIILNDVSHEIDYEGDYNSKVRTVIWTLRFTVKGYLYGPVSNPKIIRNAITNIYDTTLLSGKNVLFYVADGLGNFVNDEVVYQGYSYDTALGTAKVVNWNPNLMQLVVKDIKGDFVSNSSIKGVTSHSDWNITSSNIVDSRLARISITPNPSDVVMPNNYTYTVTITDWNGESSIVSGNTQNYIIIDLMNPNQLITTDLNE